MPSNFIIWALLVVLNLRSSTKNYERKLLFYPRQISNAFPVLVCSTEHKHNQHRIKQFQMVKSLGLCLDAKLKG